MLTGKMKRSEYDRPLNLHLLSFSDAEGDDCGVKNFYDFFLLDLT